MRLFQPASAAEGYDGIVMGADAKWRQKWQGLLQQKCPYETLQLPVDVPPNKHRLRKAVIKAEKRTHPDKGGNDDEFLAVKRAAKVLSDERCRSVYSTHGWAGVFAEWQKQEPPASDNSQQEPPASDESHGLDSNAEGPWLLALPDGRVITAEQLAPKADPLGIASRKRAAGAGGPPACWPSGPSSSSDPEPSQKNGALPRECSTALSLWRSDLIAPVDNQIASEEVK